MTAPSSIPTVASPDVCSISVLIDGTEISTQFEILSATVSRELNRIPSATLHLRDGEAAKQTFEVSDTDHFVPGKQIELRLGYRGVTESVFAGVIVTQRVRVRRNETLLMLGCRDEAIRMTRGPKSRYFTDVTDADLIDQLVGEYGLARRVAETGPPLAEVVQFDSTDWDFLVCRAEANGFVVAVRDGAVEVGPPDVTAGPAVSTAFGATILELDAEIDARLQVRGVTATSWDAADQTLVTAEATEPAVTESGNLDSAALADVLGGDAYALRHGGRLSEPELQAWALGRLRMNRLAKVRGRVRFPGFAGVVPGDVIAVESIGARFSGNQLVSGIRHTLSSGTWETDVAFGLAPQIHAMRYRVDSVAAGGLLPAVNGLLTGVVTALKDDGGENRIRVRLPMVSDTDEGTWARLATLDAGAQRGTFFRPEIGDEVVVGFLNSDPRSPVVLGQCHSSAKPAPVPGDDDNVVKGYRSRTELQLIFDDDKKSVVVETPSGARLTLADNDSVASLTDQNGNSIVLGKGGITITSGKDVTIEATGNLTFSGANVSGSAQASLQMKGQASAEVSSSSALTLSGAVVRIN